MTSQKSISFSLGPENIQYVMDSFQLKHRNKSHWLDDLITHLRTRSSDKPKAARSKQKSYPSNLDEQFELLWDTKGKVGAKNGPKGAYNKFKKLAEGASEEGCETFTKMLMDDILNHKHEPGYPEMHLTTYLNNQRWVR